MPLYRATTPTHTFVFDDNPETAFKTILVSYEQNGAIILEKGKEDMVFGTETDEKGVSRPTRSSRSICRSGR